MLKTFFTFFIIFIKNAFFNVFYFWERFLFSSGKICYLTKPAKILLNLLNSCIKRLLSDGFNMAAIKHSLMKSRNPQTLSLSCIIKTVILQGNFSLGLINFVNLSRTFFIQRFLTFFIFSIKTRFLTLFILGVNVFLHLWLKDLSFSKC